MFPFASHATYGYDLDYCSDVLEEAGALAKKYGHRLTTHPGQYTQLGSNKPTVIEAAVRELTYHCKMLDLMGVGPDGVMIVHVRCTVTVLFYSTSDMDQGGGTYEDKEAALKRMKHTITKLLPQNVRDRLVLENDEVHDS